MHEAIDFGENEQEHLVIKIDQRKRAAVELLDKAVQTCKITIKLPEVVQNSLPTRTNEVGKFYDFRSLEFLNSKSILSSYILTKN